MGQVQVRSSRLGWQMGSASTSTSGANISWSHHGEQRGQVILAVRLKNKQVSVEVRMGGRLLLVV